MTLALRDVQLARVDAFIPVADSIVTLNDVLTALLLYAQFFVTRNRALLVLANGYLFAGLLIIPHQLTFPGAYSPSGLLGANLQSAAWLFVFRNALFIAAALVYTVIRREPTDVYVSDERAKARIALNVTFVIATTIFLTWLTTTDAVRLPSLMADRIQGTTGYHNFVQPLRLVVALLAIPVLLRRPVTVIDLWFHVSVWSWFLVQVVANLAPPIRFSLVFYVSFALGFLSSCFVLLSLLSEAMMLHARLVLSVAAREQERAGRRTAMDVVVGSIAHELRQPLASIVANAKAGELFAAAVPARVGEVPAIFSDIGTSARRASDTLDSLRSMFTQSSDDRGPFDANQLVRDATGLLRTELESHAVDIRFELASDLPPIHGHGGQMMQVLTNGLTNALESLAATVDRPRLIWIETARSPMGVTIAIADSGIGLDPQMRVRVFEPFSTTKAHGMGLGLSICRSIVEAHGGTLELLPREGHGALFRVDLPAASPGAGRVAESTLGLDDRPAEFVEQDTRRETVRTN